MRILSLFRQKPATGSADTQPLTVLYAMTPAGLSQEDCFVLKDMIAASTPIPFAFLNPGSFEIFFPGTVIGIKSAERLSRSYKQGLEAVWSVTVDVTSEYMEISGNVEIEMDTAEPMPVYRDVFKTTEITTDCKRAAEVISEFADQVSEYVDIE